ncbi:MAG: class I SAM-dependent methyltransferase [Chitinophagaceae bacterium]|nr:class I SAM-dependent methyltransferase [Chitinophagaceae bacterium]
MFENRLTKKFRHLRKQARQQGISCYRVYDHDIPEFPFCLEMYGDKLYAAEYLRRHGMNEEDHDIWLDQSLQIAARVLGIEPDQIHQKLRRRKSGREGQYQKLGEEKEFFNVEEDGLLFKVNLNDYLDTGLFLDHRISRKMVRQQSEGKNVLNLFAYTGSFSVYAAAGGAAEVVTVDLSNTYLNWARENMALNGFTDPQRYQFIAADVLQWIEQAPPNHFDLVVLDPPTFSNSKKMNEFLDIQRDHVRLVNQVLQTMKPGGVLYFSTNARKFIPEKDKINAAIFQDITRQTMAFDFEGKLERLCYRIVKP